MATLAERFDALADRSEDHHLWRGATDRNGVPQIRVNGRLTTARRVAWELRHGRLAPNARVQACATDSRCVRVEHLTVVHTRPAVPRPARVRRPRGEGSMREIRPGVWKLTVAAESHGRVSRTITADPTEAATSLARLAALHGHPPTTLDALVRIYLAHLADKGRSAATLRRYEQLWRTWLSPSLAATHPDYVHRPDIERALTAMRNAGQSHRSIHQAAVVLNITFAWAVEQHLTQANPVTGCRLPNGTTLTASRHPVGQLVPTQRQSTLNQVLDQCGDRGKEHHRFLQARRLFRAS